MSRCRSDSIPRRCGGLGMDAQVIDSSVMFHTFHTFHTSFAPPREGARARTRASARARAHPSFSVWKVWKVWKNEHPCGFQAPYLSLHTLKVWVCSPI